MKLNPVMLKGVLSAVTALNLRQLISLGMVLLLTVTTVACGGAEPQRLPQGGGQLAPPTQANSTQSNSTQSNSTQSNSTQSNSTKGETVIADGQYEVQQATYNDGNGEYTIFLLNTAPDVPTPVRTSKLQMAQLTAEEVSGGKNPYLQVKGGQPALHIPKDFKLEYVHNVVEQVQNPQTGEMEQRVVRNESNFWSPFAGAIAGQVIGNMLFRPRYYVPPQYQSGGGRLSGYGGYGDSYNQASSSYRERYQQPPVAERNRTVYRSSTQRSTATGFGSVRKPRSSVNDASSQRSTGNGFGSSTLGTTRSSGGNRRSPSSGFGSGRSSSSGSRSAARRRR